MNSNNTLIFHPKLLAKFYTFIICCFCLFSAKTQAQPGHRNSAKQVGKDTIYAQNQIIVRNNSKDTLEIAAFKNGKKNGKQQLFYVNGDLNRLAYFKDNLLQGKVEYFAQGTKNPNRIEHYKAFPKEQKSLLHGLYKSFGAKGELLEKTNYKNGLKDGKYELYYNNAVLKEKGRYRDILIVGRKYSYNADGTLIRDENYIIINNPAFQKVITPKPALNGPKKELPAQPEKLSVLDGKVKYYYSNGQLASDLNFRNGKKEGVCREYHQDKAHSLKSEVNFKDGLEHGAFTYYRSEGKLERKGIYFREIKVGDTILKNVYDGTIEVYQENGKRSRIENWKNFKKNGIEESYSYKTGELSERSNYIDNLKSGTVERFDKEGNTTYLAYFEIVENDGHKISQQTATETYWDKGGVKTVVQWENGKQEGATKSYYPNGQLEKIMNFVDGKLKGKYQTYYENGQLKDDLEYQSWIGTGNNEFVDWNTSYDELGNITRKFFALGNTKNLVEHHFENGQRQDLIINNVFRLYFSASGTLSSVQFEVNGYPTFGYDLFSNQQLRKVHFQVDGLPPLKASFATDGSLLQIQSSTGASVNDRKIDEIAKKVAAQYNPKWENEILATKAFPDGKYSWNYADGSPFFKIEFKDNLPEGKWISYNPITKDTLLYSEFSQGLPVGKRVSKKIDGTTEVRMEYFADGKVKESFRFGEKGIISNISRKDSTGVEIFYADYYPDGTLKDKRLPKESSYINFTANGDTLSYNLLFTKRDSIRIERQFFAGNKLKVDRFNNLTSGIGSVKTYFENGQLQTSQELKYRKPHGIYQKFNMQGVLESTGSFKDGKRDGKWIVYKDNIEEISYYKDGEIIIQENIADDENCKCYDTSLPSGKIGFAPTLANFSDFKSIQPYIPKTIIPINDWNYDNIFYINLITNNVRTNGNTSFKLLLFKDFSFHYPAKNYLTFNLNPCLTPGYIGNFEANVSYNFDQKQIMYSQFSPKRISVSLEKNPLVNAKDKTVFTAFLDTESINFNADGIESIRFGKEKNDCFPLGLINDFMSIKIEKAELFINPKNRRTTHNLPLLTNEIMEFYGFEITAAKISFEMDSVQIDANCEIVLAGSNYVAGRISIVGNSKNENEFLLSKSKKSLNIPQLKKLLESKGFYRVKTEIQKDRLIIEFYAEK